MLSDHLTGRGGNRGACAQPCRWEYALVEKKRPGEYWPIEEDARGTYLLSAYDLNMLSHLPELINAGIGSLKIEGRMKTEYYVAAVTRVYRAALDLLAQSESAYRGALPELQEELPRLKSGFATYFPSMAQDVLIHRRQTEILLLNGAISRYGAACGVPTPLNDALSQMILCIQASYDRQYREEKP
jgi:putative protease